MALSSGPVVVVGEPLVAFIAADGPLPTARAYAAHVTGAEANLAIALARLGHPVEFIGRTGADGLGALIRRTLRGEGVGVGRLTATPDAATGVLIREAAGHGPAEVVYHRAGSAGSLLAVADLPGGREFYETAAILYVSGITPALSASARQAVTAAVGRADEAGAVVALDVNMRRRLWGPAEARDALSPLLPLVDVLFADDAELEILVDEAPEVAIGQLHDRRVGTVVRKRGRDGAEAWAAGQVPVRVGEPGGVVARDTVGAGDAFAAGFLSALLDGERDLGVALDRAHLMGGYAVSAVGDTTALPERWRLGLTDTVR